MAQLMADPLPETMFTLSRVSDIAVLNVTCPAIRERQAQVLGRYLSELTGHTGGRIVLEVGGVGSFSCAWINELLSVTRRCRAMGGDLVLLGMPLRDWRVLETTGLSRHLTLTRSRTDALSRLGAGEVAPWRLAVARLLDIPVGSRAA